MKKIKLIALDLDGTLLNEASKISPGNQAAVESALQAGVEVVINTGRPYTGATEEFLEQLNLKGAGHYSVTYNGGQIAENTGNILAQNLFTYEEVLKIARWGEKLQIPVDIITDKDFYTIEEEKKSLTHYINSNVNFSKISLAELPQNQAFHKVIFSAKAGELDQILSSLPPELSEAFEVVKTCDILIEIMPKNVTKGSGLAYICKQLGISAEEVLAMGDGKNDISMLKWASLGIAPSNADIDAKAAADEVSEYSNDQDVVAKIIEYFVL